jgi:rhodanese-related sulfurtransferase
MPSNPCLGRELALLLVLSAAVAGLYNAAAKEPLAWIAKERVLEEADVSHLLEEGAPPSDPEAGETPPPAAEPNAPQRITFEEAHALFAAQKAVFVDAREAHEYESGHIAGALNIPYEYWEDYGHLFEKLEGRPIVAYCGGAECKESIHLGDRLSELGYAPVYVFFGGWREWLAAGHPTEGTVE